MSLGEKWFAAVYDRFMARSERACLTAHRASLLADVGGEVLEVGAGTGANLGHYGDRVSALTLTEPSKPMVKRLERHRDAEAAGAQVLRAPAEDLPFEDASFDSVVCTLVLCGVDDQPRALRELNRVLKPGGRLFFIEHIRSDDPKLARMQDRMNRLNNLVAHCDCNRPTLNSIESAGFSVTELQRCSFEKAPPFLQPLAVGVARAAGMRPLQPEPDAGSRAAR